jgi:hypothetical protein
MIRNDFIHETDLQLNIEYLKQLVDRREEKISGLLDYHRLVKNDPYLSSLKERFSFLSPVFNVYKFEPGKVLDVHVDADRFCTLNIPISNTVDSTTVFYELPEKSNLEYNEKRILYTVKSPVKESFRFTLTKPTLVNTSFPHSVTHYGKETRIIISWSVLKPMTFADVRDNF